MTARIYCRISLDDGDVRGLGVERQEEDCRKYAKANGLSVTAVYVDNSVSAYSGKERPEWERLKSDLVKGDTLLAYDSTRLSRNTIEQLSFIEQCHKSGIVVVSVADNTILTDQSQNLMTGIRAILAQEESRKIGERVSRAKQQKAESGQPLKARYRTFGYTNDFEVKADEAALVKEAFNRLAAGHSIYSIHQWLIEKMPKNPVTGSDWKYNTVLSLLDNPRYAGYNVYKGQIIGKGTQEALISEATWEAAKGNRHVRNNRHRYGVNNGANARKYLLTGFVYCGDCHTAMVSHQVKGRMPSYRCSTTRGGCGKIGMKMEWVDKAVSDRLLELLSSPPADHSEHVDNSAEIARLEEQIEEVQAAYRAGDLTMADMLPMLNGLRADLRDAKAVQGEAERQRQAQRFPFFANYKAWKAADVSQKRSLLSERVKAVVVLPVRSPGRKTVDLHRLEVTWADGVTENLGLLDDVVRQQQAWEDDARG